METTTEATETRVAHGVSAAWHPALPGTVAPTGWRSAATAATAAAASAVGSPAAPWGSSPGRAPPSSAAADPSPRCATSPGAGRCRGRGAGARPWRHGGHGMVVAGGQGITRMGSPWMARSYGMASTSMGSFDWLMIKWWWQWALGGNSCTHGWWLVVQQGSWMVHVWWEFMLIKWRLLDSSCWLVDGSFIG